MHVKRRQKQSGGSKEWGGVVVLSAAYSGPK